MSIDYDHLQDLTMSTRPPHHPYYVRVRWDYIAGAYNQMDLVPNETIEVIWVSPSPNGWWKGRSRDGKRRGFIPASYVRRMVDARTAMQYQSW
ncbi:hypothetical protein FRC18_009371 [Serendipita sp. 400]|nr:hypothetical protein FRC18_009371 [Serendipita sp. 400]